MGCIHGLTTMLALQTTGEVRTWVNDYIGYKSIDVINYPYFNLKWWILHNQRNSLRYVKIMNPQLIPQSCLYKPAKGVRIVLKKDSKIARVYCFRKIRRSHDCVLICWFRFAIWLVVRQEIHIDSKDQNHIFLYVNMTFYHLYIHICIRHFLPIIHITRQWNSMHK